MCSLATECVFSCYNVCSLAIECVFSCCRMRVLLLQNVCSLAIECVSSCYRTRSTLRAAAPPWSRAACGKRDLFTWQKKPGFRLTKETHEHLHLQPFYCPAPFLKNKKTHEHWHREPRTLAHLRLQPFYCLAELGMLGL